MKKHRKFTFLLPVLLLLTVLLSSCSAGGAPSSGSEDPSLPEGSDVLPAVSLDDFSEAASAYGTVTDMTEQLTFETASVQTDRINIIYMKTHTEKQAENLISGGTDSEDTVTVLRSGQNYSYCEENAPEDPSDGTAAFYGYYLRVDNVLLLVTGSPEDRTFVRETAEEFFTSLGYSGN